MRWERLFGDLDAQWEGQARLDLEAEVAERTRSERANVELIARLGRHSGQPLQLHLVTGEVVTGDLRDTGADWLLIGSNGVELLLPLRALDSLIGLGSRVGHEVTARRFGFGYALRLLMRDRSTVAITVRGGQRCFGTIDAVGADALDLAEHPAGEPRRPGNVRQVRTVPFEAIIVIASR